MRTITVAEAGAPIMLTRGGPQLEAPVEMLGWHADLLDSYSWIEDLGVAESVYGSHRRWIEREAAGVVGAITPYNFPTQINLAKLAPALAAGCTVVLKGAPDTPVVGAGAGTPDRRAHRHPGRGGERPVVVGRFGG